MNTRGIRARLLRRVLSGRVVPGLALLALSACEVPTSLPNWDTVWIAPGKSTTIPVASLLPSQVSSAPGGEAFLLSVAPVTAAASLGDACAPCSAASGAVMPKPEFALSLAAGAPLPAEVISATLASGAIDVALRHDFDFDPLRPSATARGYLVLEARSGSRVLARDSVSGNDVAWTPGVSLTRALALGAGAITGSVDVAVTLYSPAGDSTRIDASQKMTATVTPADLLVSQAQVRVADQAIIADQVELDLADVDQTVVDHQKGGALLLDIANPFDVAGNLTLTLTAPGGTVTKPVALHAGSSTVRVELSEAELGTILGRSPVHLSAAGSVSAPAGGATVRPSQGVAIASRLELTLGSKGAL